jgi:hypothetical protein
MRFLVLVFCGLTLQTSCFAQPDSSIANSGVDQFNDSFSPLISSLKDKKKSDFKLVKKLFNEAHKNYLKNYVAYSQLGDIFKQGNYDCLSGTYFLARVLKELKIPFKIFETNYHIFLTVQTERGEVLLESTDRINGLVRDQKTINDKIIIYQQTRSSNKELYLSKIRIFHELHSDQLPGLLYFNQAVEAFNQNDLRNCCLYLEQAWKIYDNQRIEVFAPILLHSIETSKMDMPLKEKLIGLIQAHQQSSLHTIASR